MREETEAVYDIIDWLRHDPDIQDVLDADDPEGAKVFYPVQQDPQSDFPYVRYSSSLNIGANDFWRRYENISMALYFVSVTKSARMLNIIADKVKAGDESAKDLNSFLRSPEYQAMYPNEPSPYRFKHLEWVDGGTTMPTEERGGAHARVLTFRCSYTVQTGLGIS